MLKALRRAVKYRAGDKFLEQLVGREQELTTFWTSMKIQELKLARKPTDAELGTAFAEKMGLETCTKGQARSKRQKVEKLEQHPNVWLSICRQDSFTGA